jgi:hypothetical protein
MLKGWSFLEKRESFRKSFLYEKALKTDIYVVRFALTALFSFKNEIFSSTDFHSGTARANAKSVLILNTVRFALLNF